MANLSSFLLMDPLEAARWRDLTAGEFARLDPVRVQGPAAYIGKYAIPARVKTDPTLQSHWDAFAMLPEVALDTEVAFPMSEEQRAARAAED